MPIYLLCLRTGVFMARGSYDSPVLLRAYGSAQGGVHVMYSTV